MFSNNNYGNYPYCSFRIDFTLSLKIVELLTLWQVWAPVVEPEHDGAFITESMYEMVKNGQINKVPLIIGINSEEYISKAKGM